MARPLKSSDLISIGLILLIPVGFVLKFFFQAEGTTLFSMVASLAVCVVTFTLIQKSTEGKKGQLLALWMQPLILIPSWYLIHFGVEATDENHFDAVTIFLVVTAFTSLCFLLGVKVGSYK